MKHIYLEYVALTNYRNFSTISLNAHEATNIIIGENGSGKTNILESISLLSPGKGLKSSNFDQICKYGCDYWRSYFRIQSKLGIAEIENQFHFTEKARRINYNGSKINSGELPNLVNVIWVTPQMESIFIDTPSVRRKFLDRIAYNFNPSHAARIAKYEHCMKERIKALANNSWQGQSEWISVIESKMALEGYHIQAARQKAIFYMQQSINNLDTDFPKPNLSLGETIIFMNDLENFVNEYSMELFNYRKKDTLSGRTNFGIHKNDLNVIHSEKQQPAKICSTGEQKAMLISIILASVESILQNTNSTPLLLLDELFTHLDELRKKQLTNYLLATKMQTFITATDIVGIEDLSKQSNIINL